MSRVGAEDLHQLQRTWELHHRLIASEAVTRHTLFREETRWPDRRSGEWAMEKAPVYHVID